MFTGKATRRLKKKAVFYTDRFSVYFEVIPWLQHRPVGKESGKTSYTENVSKIGIWATQKLPQLNDRKRAHIVKYGHVYDRSTPGLWRSRNTDF